MFRKYMTVLVALLLFTGLAVGVAAKGDGTDGGSVPVTVPSTDPEPVGSPEPIFTVPVPVEPIAELPDTGAGATEPRDAGSTFWRSVFLLLCVAGLGVAGLGIAFLIRGDKPAKVGGPGGNQGGQ